MYIAYQYRLYPTKEQSETIERRFIYARSIYKKLLTQAVTTDRRQKWPEIATAETHEYTSRTDEPKLEFRDHSPAPVESSLFYQHVCLYPLNKMICGNQKRFCFKAVKRAGALICSFNYQDTICLYPRSIYIGRIGLIKARTARVAGTAGITGIAGSTRTVGTDGSTRTVGTDGSDGTDETAQMAGITGSDGTNKMTGIAQGRPIHASVFKTRTGQYYVSLLVRYEPSRPEKLI
ncbi:MAG: helix-turn-helix domain-containing protein [Clostridiaceae bacterium]|nr:helix-turn-helix domain-containing protein [Clostridiaceae bacterium]